MAEIMLSAIIVLSLASLYMARQNPATELFERISNYYIIFVLVHAFYMAFVRCYFGSHALIDLIAPFGLAYGPFLYLGFSSLITDKIDRNKQVLLHFAPAAIFTCLFLVVISAEGLMMQYLLNYYVALYSLTAVSFIGYAIWVARFISRKSLTQKDSYTGERAMFLKSSRYLLVIMACLFTVSVLMDVMPEDEKIQIKLTAITVYAGMLAAMCITFRYKVRSVFTKVTVYSQKQKIPIAKENEHVIRHLSAPQKYLKSGLTQDMVEEYKKRLDNSFEKEQVFLDSSLTLEALAKHLKMPPHHLTQIFNVYIGENFNQYMNKYRIEYASLLLANNKEDSTIEDIAFSSGFNNKVSFNRHFKNLMGCTPKEFANNDKAES